MATAQIWKGGENEHMGQFSSLHSANTTGQLVEMIATNARTNQTSQNSERRRHSREKGQTSLL